MSLHGALIVSPGSLTASSAHSELTGAPATPARQNLGISQLPCIQHQQPMHRWPASIKALPQFPNTSGWQPLQPPWTHTDAKLLPLARLRSKLSSLAAWMWHKPQFSNHCLRQKCQSWTKLPRLGCLTWHVYSSWKPNKFSNFLEFSSSIFLLKKQLINYFPSNFTIRKQNYKCTHANIYIQTSTKYNYNILPFLYI